MNKFNDETKETLLKRFDSTINLFVVGLGSLFAVSLAGVSVIIITAILSLKAQAVEINRLLPFLSITVIYLLSYSVLTTKTRNSSNTYKLLQILKRFIDLVLTSFGFIVIAPALMIIIFLIKASSPGPGIVRSRVVGQFGKLIDIYKFRTRYVGSVEMQFTPIGKFLHRLALDELPLLYSVLEGELSLVGPSPRSPAEDYTSRHSQEKILSVRPGVTGPVVVAKPSSLQEAEKLELEYIENWSLLLDFKILLKTTRTVLRDLR